VASVPPRNSDDRKAAALRALDESGGDRNSAVAAANVSLAAIKEWRKKDAAFDQAWDEIVRRHIDNQRSGHRHSRDRFSFPAIKWERKDTAENREKVLQYLSAGATCAIAAEAIGVHRSTLMRWRADDKEFANDWDEAIEHGTDLIEEEAIRRAIDGVMRPVFQSGELVGFIREYSDLLLKFLLEGKRPSVYRRGTINLAAPDNGGELIVRWQEPEGRPSVTNKPAQDSTSAGHKTGDST